MRLKNKVAIITGSASGFGKGIAKKFTEEGARIILVDINSKLLKKVSKKYSQDYFVADVSKDSNFKSLAKYVKKNYHKLDIVVNNAGITHKPKPMEKVTENEFNNVFKVNAKSVYYCAKYFVPKMKRLKRGIILNIASTAGLSPRPKLNWYNASKGWMITATKAMAIELAPHKVRVNAIAPGGIFNNQNPTFISNYSKRVPLGRLANEKDIVNLMLFLLSEDSSYITGAVIPVDGGWSAT